MRPLFLTTQYIAPSSIINLIHIGWHWRQKYSDPPLSMNLWILASVDPVELQPSSKSWVSLSLIDDWSFFFCGVVWIRVCCSVEECLKFCNASSILPPLGINPVKILFHWPYKEFNLKEVMSRYTHRQTWMRQPRTYCQRTHKAMYSVTTGILKTNYI